MATWASYTSEQQAAVQGVANACRGLAIDVFKAAAGAIPVSAAWSLDVSALVAGLDSTEIIPNDTSYADARDFSPADLTNLVTLLGALTSPSGTFFTTANQQLLLKACGVNAALG